MIHVGTLVFRAPNRGLEGSLFCRVAGKDRHKRKVASQTPELMFIRGWWNTAGGLIEICWAKKNIRRLQIRGKCVRNRGVRFHRIRDFKQYTISTVFRQPPSSALHNRVIRSKVVWVLGPRLAAYLFWGIGYGKVTSRLPTTVV